MINPKGKLSPQSPKPPKIPQKPRFLLQSPPDSLIYLIWWPISRQQEIDRLNG